MYRDFLIMDIALLYSLFARCNSVSTDTRALIPEAMFFALKGENFNGNTFAAKALELGAKYVVMDEPPPFKDERFIVVKDSLQTVQHLANYHRKRFSIPVIALTGSNGKTTTKELIAAVLQKKFKVLFTKGNLNNHIGVPLTLLGLKEEHEIAVIEMGANHIGEIALLCQIAEPTHGMITNIGKAHLEGFGGMQGVIKAKTELYDFLKKTSGTVFMNESNKLLTECLGSYPCTAGYGIQSEKSYVSGNEEGNEKYLSLAWKCKKENGNENFLRTKLTGSYNLENVLASICIGKFFGVADDSINAAIEEYVPSNQRSQVVKAGANTIVLDAYNANPSSVEAALKNFSRNFAKPQYVFLGDMLELGTDSKTEHEKIAQLLIELGFEQVLVAGKIFSAIKLPAHFIHAADSEEALKWLLLHKPSHASILIKGSRGMKMEKLMEAFSE